MVISLMVCRYHTFYICNVTRRPLLAYRVWGFWYNHVPHWRSQTTNGQPAYIARLRKVQGPWFSVLGLRVRTQFIDIPIVQSFLVSTIRSGQRERARSLVQVGGSVEESAYEP